MQTPAAQTAFSWTQAPDLMTRLSDAQNELRRPINIMTYAGMCGSRDELERHVVRYEGIVAAQPVLKARRSRQQVAA